MVDFKQVNVSLAVNIIFNSERDFNCKAANLGLQWQHLLGELLDST